MFSKFPRYILLLLLLLSISACGSLHPLVASPNLYIEGDGYTLGNASPTLKTTTPDIFYVTDRKPLISADGGMGYGSGRSASMAFGAATVRFGEDLSWTELRNASGATKRKPEIVLTLGNVAEIVRFPETPLPFSVRNGTVEPLPQAQAAYRQATELMRNTIEKRLTQIQGSDIVLFVHGFNNDFEEAALALADIWHFTGRVGVPIFYTWPAASGGLFGYFKDRESGEYSIYHLKEFLRILASTKSVERIHIVAHSRGTDITTTALRELVIESRAAGKKPRKALKIQNLVLAAPDLDFGVVRQRLIAEKFGPALGQITVYMNQGDAALRFSQFLMAGLRFGKLNQKDLDENDKKIFARVKNVNFINVEGVNSFVGHAYYREHPGVLSDIAILIGKRLAPGEPGRPLQHNQINFWTLPKNYPLNERNYSGQR
jgi:esterase/lipase superfamily enzyme